MPLPVRDENHVVEAQKLLTDFLKPQPNVNGLLGAFTTSIQKIEDAFQDYLVAILFDNAVGDVLDKYGAILLIGRAGRSDADYKIALRLRMRVLLSNGLSEDIIQCCALALASFEYDDWEPAAWTVLSYDVPNPVPLLQALGAAGAAGTRGVFLFSTWPHSEDIVFGSTIGSVPNAAGFMDKGSGLFPNFPISSQDFTK